MKSKGGIPKEGINGYGGKQKEGAKPFWLQGNTARYPYHPSAKSIVA